MNSLRQATHADTATGSDKPSLVGIVIGLGLSGAGMCAGRIDAAGGTRCSSLRLEIIRLNVGRVAPETNLISFLNLDLDGTKVAVGDGPQPNELKASYLDVIFPGAKQGEALAA